MGLILGMGRKRYVNSFTSCRFFCFSNIEKHSEEIKEQMYVIKCGQSQCEICWLIRSLYKSNIGFKIIFENF